MSEERQRVLQMLKAGKITVEEAEALLEALEAEQEAGSEGPGQQPAAASTERGAPAQSPTGPTPAVDAPAGTASSGEQPPDRPKEVHQLIDDIIASVDVDGIVATVQESLRRSRVDVHRIKDEVRRAAYRAREESRRAAREYRRHRFGRRGFGMSISRAIEGLWGLSDASGTWSHEADLGAGRSLSIGNIWGDVKLEPSPDGRLHLEAATRAWGHDEAEARSHRDQIRITAADEGSAYAVRVEPPAGNLPRRFRVDFDIKVPAGVSVAVSQAKGDIDAQGLTGTLTISVASGDVTVRGQGGSVRVESAKSDVTLERIGGDARVSSKHGDVVLADVGGRAEVSLFNGDITATRIKGDVDLRTLHGDVELQEAAGRIVAHTKSGDLSLAQPAGPVVLDLQTASGDVEVEIGQLSAGASSTISTMSGDVAVRLGEGARCRITARVTSGDIRADAPLVNVQQSRQSLQGVVGSPDATLDLSTVSGDISINAQRVDAGIRS